MSDFYLPFIILTLIVVIVILVVDKHFSTTQYQAQIAKLIAAVMSENIHEYNATIRTEKEPKPRVAGESDEIEISQATAEAFDDFITKANK